MKIYFLILLKPNNFEFDDCQKRRRVPEPGYDIISSKGHMYIYIYRQLTVKIWFFPVGCHIPPSQTGGQRKTLVPTFGLRKHVDRTGSKKNDWPQIT